MTVHMYKQVSPATLVGIIWAHLTQVSDGPHNGEKNGAAAHNVQDPEGEKKDGISI